MKKLLQKLQKLPKTFLLFIPLIYFIIYMAILFPITVLKSSPELKNNYIRSVLLNIPFVAVPVFINALICTWLYPKMVQRKIGAGTFVKLFLTVNTLLLGLGAFFAALAMTTIEHGSGASMNNSMGYFIGFSTTFLFYFVIDIFFIKEAQDYSR